MSLELVRELNGDHRALLKTLGRIADIGSLTSETRTLLAETKRALVGHLDKEEKEFYPAIRKIAASDSAVAEKLNAMNAEMEVISKLALAFLDKYISGGTEAAFSEEFKAFRGALAGRIQKEEFALYSHFLKAGR
jgi:hypothetical protein